MPTESDTNTLAFSRLQTLIDADATLPEDLKKAMAADLASAPQKADNLRKYFEPVDASTK